MVTPRPLRLSADEQKRLYSKKLKELRIARVLQVRELAKRAQASRLEQYRNRLVESESNVTSQLFAEWHEKKDAQCRELYERIQKDRESLGKGHKEAAASNESQRRETESARKLQQVFSRSTVDRVRAVVAADKKEKSAKLRIKEDSIRRRKHQLLVDKERAHKFGEKQAAVQAKRKKADETLLQEQLNRTRKGRLKLTDFKNSRLHQSKSPALVRLHEVGWGSHNSAASRAKEEEKKLMETRIKQAERAAWDQAKAEDRCKLAIQKEHRLKERERIEQVLELMQVEKRKRRLDALKQGDLSDAPLLRVWQRQQMQRKLQDTFEELFISPEPIQAQPEAGYKSASLSSGFATSLRPKQLSPVPETIPGLMFDESSTEMVDTHESDQASRAIITNPTKNVLVDISDEQKAAQKNSSEEKCQNIEGDQQIMQQQTAPWVARGVTGSHVLNLSGGSDTEQHISNCENPVDDQMIRCKNNPLLQQAGQHNPDAQKTEGEQAASSSSDDPLAKSIKSQETASTFENSVQLWLTKYLEDDPREKDTHHDVPSCDKTSDMDHRKFHQPVDYVASKTLVQNTNKMDCLQAQKTETLLPGQKSLVVLNGAHGNENNNQCEVKDLSRVSKTPDVQLTLNKLHSTSDETALSKEAKVDNDSHSSNSSRLEINSEARRTANLDSRNRSEDIDIGLLGSETASTVSLEIEHLLSRMHMHDCNDNWSAISGYSSNQRSGFDKETLSTSDTISLSQSMIGSSLIQSKIIRTGLGVAGNNLDFPSCETANISEGPEAAPKLKSSSGQDTKSADIKTEDPWLQKSSCGELCHHWDSAVSDSMASHMVLSSCDNSFWQVLSASGASTPDSPEGRHQGTSSFSSSSINLDDILASLEVPCPP